MYACKIKTRDVTNETNELKQFVNFRPYNIYMKYLDSVYTFHYLLKKLYKFLTELH